MKINNNELVKIRRGKRLQSLSAETPKLDYSQIDARHLRRSGRIIQFATKVTPEFDQTIRQISQQKGYLIVEVLEEMMETYLKHLDTDRMYNNREREKERAKSNSSLKK